MGAASLSFATVSRAGRTTPILLSPIAGKGTPASHTLGRASITFRTRRKSSVKSNGTVLARHRISSSMGSSSINSNEDYGQGNDKERKLGADWSVEKEIDRIFEDESLFKDLKAAAERVAKARAELEHLEALEREARTEGTNHAETLLVECENDVRLAEAEVRKAERALVEVRAGGIWQKWDTSECVVIEEDKERVQSAKAASISAIVGTLASLPWRFAHQTGFSYGAEMLASTGLVFICCALFGLTYRYAIRRDIKNTELKSGCVAAFGIVKAAGQIDVTGMLQMLDSKGLGVQELFQGCLYMGESFVSFAFAAVSLEYCFWLGVISPFPIKGA